MLLEVLEVVIEVPGVAAHSCEVDAHFLIINFQQLHLDPATLVGESVRLLLQGVIGQLPLLIVDSGSAVFVLKLGDQLSEDVVRLVSRVQNCVLFLDGLVGVKLQANNFAVRF